MFSILIPTYDHNVFPLVQELEKQVLQANIEFELICMDDGSFSPLNEENQKINALTNCKFIENKKNVGRVANRVLLAEKAQYNWLLFLDADVFPKHNDYLKKVIDEIMISHFDAIFGGFAYKDDFKDPRKSLRFTFGKKREEVSAEKRNKNPFKVIISANMIIKKDVFLKLAKTELRNTYGMDYLFGSLLKNGDYSVNHIDNEVYHLGAESNQVFLNKTKQALYNLHLLYKENKIGSNQISILKTYQTLKTFGLTSPFGKIANLFNTEIEKNLYGPKPKLALFDLYRLGYLCRL